MATKQLSMLQDPRKNTKLWWIVKRNVYGGSLNYRKVRRPFDSKKLTHTVFKAKLGSAIWFTRSQGKVWDIAHQSAKRYGVRIKNLAINRDHIHILLYTRSREVQIRFLRFFSAEMGRMYKQIRGTSGLWVARPFTRLVSWGRRSLKAIARYFERNRFEAFGFVDYKPRSHRISSFLERWERQLSKHLAFNSG